MPIVYKVDVLSQLKAAGYSTYRLRKEKLMGERVIQQLRTWELVSWKTVETICTLLHCQPGDLFEFVPGVGDEYNDDKLASANSHPMGAFSPLPYRQVTPESTDSDKKIFHVQDYDTVVMSIEEILQRLDKLENEKSDKN